MGTTKRLTRIAAASAALATGCADREVPVSPPAVSLPPNATAAVSTSTATSSLIAIEDALHRVIPGLEGGGDAADALHDAFDRVADALDSGDPRLGKLVETADALLADVASNAAAAWGPDLDVLQMTLEAVSATSDHGRGGSKRN